DDVPSFDVALGLWREALAVIEIRADAEVREEERILEDAAHATILGREIDMLPRVEQHAARDGDASALRPHDARDRMPDRRLSGSRFSEECDDRRIGRECRLDRERSAPK